MTALVLHGGALGDLVLTIQLALRLPIVERAGAIDVVSRVDPGDLSACRPALRRQSSEGLGLHWLFGDHDDPPPERLRDLVRGRWVLSALGGRHTISHRRLEALQPATMWGLDPRPVAGVERHITEQWRTQLEAQGLLVPKCVHQKPDQRGLGVPDAISRRGMRLLRAAGAADGCVLIHPGSGGRAKCWPLEHFIELARRLSANGQVPPCFIVGPAELDTWTKSELAALAAEFAVLCQPEPTQLVELLAAARVLIGNDSGPAHLAALLGTPTVTLFGPTSARVWHPLGGVASVMVGDTSVDRETWGLTVEQVLARV